MLLFSADFSATTTVAPPPATHTCTHELVHSACIMHPAHTHTHTHGERKETLAD